MENKFRTFKYEETLHANNVRNEIFELLCPRREYDWIPHWECEIIHSKNGFNEEGCIFTTNSFTNNPWTWFTTEFNKEKGVVRFVIFASDLFVLDYSITVTDTGKKSSDLTFSQVFRAISEEGNNVVKNLTQKKLSARIKPLEKMLNSYLAKNE